MARLVNGVVRFSCREWINKSSSIAGSTIINNINLSYPSQQKLFQDYELLWVLFSFNKL
jgi:hypothetical protein